MTQHVAHRTSDEVAKLRRELAEAESRIKEGIQFRIAREEDNTLLARELVSTRSHLAALQAEARKVVGPFAAEVENWAKVDGDRPAWMVITSHANLTRTGLSNQHGGLLVSHFRAARAFLSSLPSPAVVAVPVEPGKEDIEAMATHFACSEMFGLEWATTKFGPEIIENRIRMGWTERFNDDETWAGEDGEPRTTKGKTSMRAEALATYRALVKRHGG